MLRLINPMLMEEGAAEKAWPLHVEDDAWYVTHAYDGRDKLTFQIVEKEEYRDYIAEEALIETEDNLYTIKNIDSHADLIVVDCLINLDDWRAGFYHTYRKEALTIGQAVADVLPSGWSINMSSTLTGKHTVEASEGEPVMDATPLDILDRICEIWECVANFDVKEKIVKIIDPEAAGDSGDFYSEEMNLKSVGYVGNSTEYATRIYPYGKKDETTGAYVDITSVNGGLPYIEDRMYADKIVSFGYTDERFTNPAALYNDAMQRLHERAYPTVSYELSVRELGPGTAMYKTCTLIEGYGRVKHQVVEYRQYPMRPDLDTVTLSTVMPDISDSVLKDEKQKDELTEWKKNVDDILKNQMIERDNLQEYLNKCDKVAGGTGNSKGKISVEDNNGNEYMRIDKDGAKLGTTDSPADIEIVGSLLLNGQEITGGGSGGGGGLPIGDNQINLDIKESENALYHLKQFLIQNLEKNFAYMRVLHRKKLADGTESYILQFGEPTDSIKRSGRVLQLRFGDKTYDFRNEITAYGTAVFEGPDEDTGGAFKDYHMVQASGMKSFAAKTYRSKMGNETVYMDSVRIGNGAICIDSSASTTGNVPPDEKAFSHVVVIPAVVDIDELWVKGTDGRVHKIVIDADGNLSTTTNA